MSALSEKGLPEAAARRPVPPFAEEHEQLRDSLRRFVARELRPHTQEWEDARWFPDEVFARMAELGFLGLKYPEEYGGQGGGAGYMREYEIERVVRDTRLGPIGGGTDEVMKEILGEQLGL